MTDPLAILGLVQKQISIPPKKGENINYQHWVKVIRNIVQFFETWSLDLDSLLPDPPPQKKSRQLLVFLLAAQIHLPLQYV